MNLADRGPSRKKPARPEWRAMRRSWFSPSGLILLWFVPAISWALQDPSAIPGYLGLRLIVATLISALSVALLWRWAAVWKQRHGGTTFVTDRHSHLAVLGLLGCSAVLTVIAWVGPFS